MALVRRASRPSAHCSTAKSEVAVDQVSFAVNRASFKITSASCLALALSGWMMLARRGVPSQIRLGARREPSAGDLAHAWLEYQGRCVIGSNELDAVIPFPNAS